MQKLVLFDIDGTLLSTEGAAGCAFEAALVDVYGTTGPIAEVSFAGKTDPQIAHLLLAAAGLSRVDIDSRLPNLWSLYLENLGAALERVSVRVYPGVVACLEMVETRTEDALLGLLTGNIEAGARCKLDASGIGFERFRVGGFGSDSEHRNELPAIAARRAEACAGASFVGADVVIVGDTPADIECGMAFGARTVAVATGVYSSDELHACKPDFLFDSLEDTASVWDAIMS